MDKSSGPSSKSSFAAADHPSACMANPALKDNLRCAPHGGQIHSRSIIN